MLTERDAAGVDLNLICDALDFLATDYWSARYDRLPTEEMLTRCSEKYGRPFEVKPTGVTTIEYTPGQYKIKYFPGRNGKPVESALDYHLAIRNGRVWRIPKQAIIEFTKEQAKLSWPYHEC